MEFDAYRTLVEKHRDLILEVEQYLWKHPETGFREWNTTKYLAGIFEAAGYTLHMAGDIPGFYTDLETGRPGPKILIMGEMDALLAPNHPEAVNGCAHACGHHAQCAELVGAALALKEPGALDGLCGSIRFMAVPAEELIEVSFRESLRQKGVIHYLGGKVEYLYRGYMDGCDIAYLLHATNSRSEDFNCYDSNGCITKEVTYKGVAAHAGGSPQSGVNALYAASLGLQAVNAIRETFLDSDHVRVHPIMTSGGSSVNIIPSEATLSTFIRGASLESIRENNRKVTRALAGAAVSLGAKVTVHDRPGYAPLLNDPGIVEAAGEIAVRLLGADRVNMHKPWGSGSTDMGDLSCVMRTFHPHIGGASGRSHGDDYRITDPELTCVTGAVIEVLLAVELLKDGAARARQILAGPPLRYPDKAAYFADMDSFFRDSELVTYDENRICIEF